ncbi:hypothetical protein B1A85_23265, partial [Chroococcidiopsis sp. TS-821]
FEELLQNVAKFIESITFYPLGFQLLLLKISLSFFSNKLHLFYHSIQKHLLFINNKLLKTIHKFLFSLFSF